MSNTISLVRGTTKALAIDLVDDNGATIPLTELVGASATFSMRNDPTDLTDVLAYNTTDNPTNLAFEIDAPVLDLTFQAADTTSLALQLYYYRVQVTLANGTIYDVIEWSLLDLNLGGAAAVEPPVFTNTVSITQDYPLSNDMTYQTPGGSPIENAQVRVYYKTDYVAGRYDAPVGITTTDAYGKWRNPILVVPGFTYVARLEKANEFGPDVKEFFA